MKCDGEGTRCFLKWNPETLAVRQRGKKWGRHSEQSNTGSSNSTAIWHDGDSITNQKDTRCEAKMSVRRLLGEQIK